MSDSVPDWVESFSASRPEDTPYMPIGGAGLEESGGGRTDFRQPQGWGRWGAAPVSCTDRVAACLRSFKEPEDSPSKINWLPPNSCTHSKISHTGPEGVRDSTIKGLV